MVIALFQHCRYTGELNKSWLSYTTVWEDSNKEKKKKKRVTCPMVLNAKKKNKPRKFSCGAVG